MSPALATLQERFRDRADRDRALFERHLAEGDHGAPEVEAAAHKLAGAAAIFGFTDVGEAARAVDRTFAAGGTPDRGMLEALVARLSALVAEAAEGPARTLEARAGGETILIVEDDDLIRANAERQLQGLGYRVIAAADGDAVLDRIETLPAVDLLFTDLMLPGAVDGRALAHAMRRDRPGLRVLFTSGRAMPDDTAGAGFLAKPYRRAALEATVREMLEDRAQPTDGSGV